MLKDIPIVEFFKWILPGVDTSNQKRQKLYKELRGLVPEDDPRAQQIALATDAYARHMRNPEAASNTLMKALLPKPKPPVAPKVQEAEHFLGLGKDEQNLMLKFLYRGDEIKAETADEDRILKKMLGELKDKSERYGVDERSRVALLGQENRSDIAAADRAQDQYNVDERTRAAILGHTMTSETARRGQNIKVDIARMGQTGSLPPGEQKIFNNAANAISEAQNWLDSPQAAMAVETVNTLSEVKQSPYLDRLYGQRTPWGAFFDSRLNGDVRDLANRVQEIKTGQALEALSYLKGSTSEKELEEVKQIEATILDPVSSVGAVVKALDRLQRLMQSQIDKNRTAAAETPAERVARFRAGK